MQCPRCGHDNRAQAKFCEECASPLTRSCEKCSHPLPPTAKFCPECAHPAGAEGATPSRFASPEAYTPKHLAEKIVTSRASLEGERKQVTVLFADMKGSTELLADRDPEDGRALLDPVLTLLMEVVHRYEGTVNQVLGDGIMALFGAPLAHEGGSNMNALRPARSCADTHTLACRSKPSRCACRGPRDVTAAVSRVSTSRRTRATERWPSATRPWTEASTISASTGDSSANRSAGPVASSAASRPWRTSSRCTRWRIVASAPATSAPLGPGAE